MIRNASGSLNSTPEGNMLVLETMENLAKRQMREAEIKDWYYNKYRSFNPPEAPSLNEYLRQYDEENPVITDEMLERIRNFASPGEDVNLRNPLGGGDARTPDEKFRVLTSITSQDQFESMLNQIDPSVISRGLTNNPQLIRELSDWQLRMMRQRIAGQR